MPHPRNTVRPITPFDEMEPKPPMSPRNRALANAHREGDLRNRRGRRGSSQAPGTDENGEPRRPTERDVAQASARQERRQRRRYGNRGYLSTVLQSNRIGQGQDNQLG